MIIEERTYTIQVGKVNAYRDYYQEHALEVQKRILGNLLGFFTSDLGELNQVIQLWGYDSYAERERRRAILATDPDWLAYLRTSPQVILRQESRVLLPASFSPIA